jgi:hypothetical protein
MECPIVTMYNTEVDTTALHEGCSWEPSITVSRVATKVFDAMESVERAVMCCDYGSCMSQGVRPYYSQAHSYGKGPCSPRDDMNPGDMNQESDTEQGSEQFPPDSFLWHSATSPSRQQNMQRRFVSLLRQRRAFERGRCGSGKSVWTGPFSWGKHGAANGQAG